MRIPAVWRFFTMWQFCLLLLASFPSFQWIAEWVNLPFLSTVVFIGGFYISWMEPRAYYIKVLPFGGDETSTVWTLHSWPIRLTIDILFHFIPLIYAYLRFSPVRIDRKTTFGTVFLLSLYFCLFSTPDVYHISFDRFLIPFALSLAFFLLVVTQKKKRT